MAIRVNQTTQEADSGGTQKEISSVIVVAATVFLLLIVGSYFLLVMLTDGVQNDIESLNEELEAGGTPAQEEARTVVTTYQRKVNDILPLLEQHSRPTKIMSFLEEHTHPRLRFQNFGFDATSREISVSGFAESFTALSQQYRLLQQSDATEKVGISEATATQQGSVEFQMTFRINTNKLSASSSE